MLESGHCWPQMDRMHTDVRRSDELGSLRSSGDYMGLEDHGGHGETWRLPRNRDVWPLHMNAVMHAARALRQSGASCGEFRLGKYICHMQLTLDLDDSFDSLTEGPLRSE